MNTSTITTAQTEYYRRPADERYTSTADLIAAAKEDQRLSGERSYNLRDLRATAIASPERGHTVRLQGPKGTAVFTHWAFGQFCRMIQAPASYIRELSPTLAAQCLNEGISKVPNGQTATLLVRAPNGRPEPQIRSMTSDSYGRLWDAPLYEAIDHQLPGFELPPTREGSVAGGAYRGDRDSFVIKVDGGSIVNDPSIRGGDGRMFRGVMVRNSEVGACSVSIERVLFQYICSNHCLWGAVIDRKYKRRHVGSHVLRDVVREIGTIAHAWTNRTASQDEALIRLLIDHELATTKDAIIDELHTMGATKEQAKAAYEQTERSERFSASPRSFWGLSQGLTEISQETEYQSDRLLLDQLAAKILARGARLVAA